MIDLEIEARFSVKDPDWLAKHGQDLEMANCCLGIYKEVWVQDKYLDTSQQDIWESGFTLRVRECEGQCSITLKSSRSQHDRWSVREQIEFSVGTEIDIEHWSDDNARALVTHITDGKRLRETVELRQMRGERDVYSDGDPVARLSMDQVQVWMKGKQLDEFYVLEVELLPHGEPEILEEICIVLESEGLRPLRLTKLERAFQAAESYMH